MLFSQVYSFVHQSPSLADLLLVRIFYGGYGQFKVLGIHMCILQGLFAEVVLDTV